MKTKDVVGIDVSKLTLDCHIHCAAFAEKFANSPEGIKEMIAWAEMNGKSGEGETLFVFEHTGLYSKQLCDQLAVVGHAFHVVPGLEIHRSLGIARGKNDKADAKRIALYGYRTKEEIKPYRMPREEIARMKNLMSLRKKLVEQRAGHQARLGEQRRILGGEHYKLLLGVQEELIEALDRQISLLEKEIDRIIQDDPELKKMQKLLTSIKGIGKVTARFLIVCTLGFTAFKTWRKFASYCGIAPFPHQSGTSVRGKTKTSNLANKEGRALLTMCAFSAIQNSTEMKAFYERRLKLGKNEMSTINIVRNKLLARAFAVVQRGSEYVETMGYAA